MQRRARIAVAALVAVALIGTAAWIKFRPVDEASTPPPPVTEKMPAEVTLVADEANPAGLATTGGLTLTTVKPLSVAAVRQNLKVEPAVALTIDQADTEGTRFTVKPAASLTPDKIYRFRLAQAVGVSRPYQWSFQTQTEFRLLGTLPRDQGTGVPVNSGIEFTFTHEDYEDLTPYFSIDPPVTGRFERHKKTVAFVPEKLEPGTVYTVTLKQGLGRSGGEGQLTEEVTFAFETQVPETQQSNFYMPTEAAEFPADSQPIFGFWYGGKDSAKPVNVTVFRYPTAEAYMDAVQAADKTPWWANASRSRYQEDVTSLKSVSTFTTEGQSFDNGTFLIFPEPMPPGYYLASVRVGEVGRQVHFQVTDLSFHVTATTTGTLVWLHDLATGKPVDGATVTDPISQKSVRTGADGVAVLPTPENLRDRITQPALLLKAEAAGKEGVIYSPPPYYWEWREQESKRDLYWKYLYLDRSLFKPDDTVQVWGVVHPREPGAEIVSEVVAEVRRSDYYGASGEVLPLVQATLPVQKGTFIGGLDLPNLKPGHYELRVRMDNDMLLSQWFEVATYAKPAYQLAVTSDKQAIFTGEPVTFDVKASFFEGTPVPGMTLNYNIGNDRDVQVATDAKGEATITYTPPHSPGEVNWYPESLWFNIHAGLAEIGEVTDERRVSLFTRDLLSSVKVAYAPESATVQVQLNQVTLDELNAGGSNYKGAAVPGRAVRFTLIEMHWNQISMGQYYDFIEKVTRTRYRYEEAHRTIGTFDATSDANGQASYTFPVDPAQQYRVEYRTLDSRGLPVSGSAYVSGREFQSPYDDREYAGWYHLEPLDPEQTEALIGEPMDLIMKTGETVVADRPNGFLFMNARRGLQGYTTQGTGTYRLVMGENDPPSMTVKAVYFDGARYHSTERYVRFDEEQRRLQVTVTPDKEAYRPGDEVRLQVEVTDRLGQPAPGTQVNLNLVDEALYALRSQSVSLLGSLYGEYITPGILRSRNSHEVPNPGGGAEKGGDGGGARRDFKDAVFFSSVTTDATGKASASFHVPDNLTTWRLTYQAFNPQSLEAGSGTTGIAVKLPFFADMVLGERFLTGDEPVLQVRAYGSALTGGEQVQFKVTVNGPGVSESSERLAVPFTPTSIPLPSLAAAGDYTVMVRANSGDLTDALEKRFTVVDTYQRHNQVDFTLLGDGTKVPGSDSTYTELTFLDWERGQYLNLLYRMRWQWGNRFEMKLARAIATDLLQQHFGRDPVYPEPELEAFRYQAPDGSIAILPYSSGDLKLSALTADLAPDRFDQVSLQLYFQQILDDEGAGRDRKILALYGLAGLDQPVLLTAQSLLAEPDLTPSEQLHLALVLAELGDLEGARPVYRSLLQAHGKQVGRELQLTAGTDTDEKLETTALAAALAGKLGEPEAPALISYLSQNQPTDSLILLEQLIAARTGLERLTGKPVAFTHNLGGQEVRESLEPGRQFAVRVSPEELEKLRITKVEGSVAVVSTYEVNGTPTLQQGGTKITRTYSPAPEEWKAGDIVSVTLSYSVPADAPKGAYEIHDYLPSGLRMLERSWQYGMQVNWNQYESWPIQIDGQRVSFWAGRSGKPIRYFARVVNMGEYQAEEPALQHQQSGLIYGLGQRAMVRTP